MAKKAKAKRDPAKDREEKWAQIEEVLSALRQRQHAPQETKDPDGPEWQERVACKGCGSHRAAKSPDDIRWTATSDTVRRMRKVNGKWETHILDDPALEKKIRDILFGEVQDLIYRSEKKPRWWQFWR